jgi:hypothetical protein
MADNGGVSVSYGDIERVSGAITSLNRFAAPLVPAVAAVAVDGDFLASAILSPATAARAEALVISASTELGATIVTTEALAIVTASVVVTYKTADAALQAAIPVVVQGVKYVVAGVEDVADVTYTVTLLGDLVGTMVVDGVRTGGLPNLITAGVVTLGESAWDALTTNGGVLNPGQLGSDFMAALGSNWNTNFAWASPSVVSMMQSTLGDMKGWGGYTALLGMLMTDGHKVGWLEDGTASLVAGLSASTMKSRADASVGATQREVGLSLTTDEHGNVVPTDVASLLASSAQIDAIGQKDVADIRIIKTVGADGVTRFTVQIPSTQNWGLKAGDVPNDFTSDLYAMQYGNNTALSNAVMAAMKKAGITDQPVMLEGFSLGGITAGAIAADPHGYNIQQVVTAGSPIGAMHIPSTTHVTSLEATQDPVATLDGTLNPSTPNWTTVHEPAYTLNGETAAPTLANAHDANRYAAMAKGDTKIDDDSSIGAFLSQKGNTTTVTDYQAQRAGS